MLQCTIGKVCPKYNFSENHLPPFKNSSFCKVPVDMSFRDMPFQDKSSQEISSHLQKQELLQGYIGQGSQEDLSEEALSNGDFLERLFLENLIQYLFSNFLGRLVAWDLCPRKNCQKVPRSMIYCTSSKNYCVVLGEYVK